MSRSSLIDALAALTADLDLLADDLRWCHANAYWPVGRGLDAPRGASLARPADPDDPDHVHAPLLDTGLGDHASARAWRLAVAQASLVEMRLALALAAAAPRMAQPLVVGPGPSTRVPVVLHVLASCRWRIDTLAQLEVVGPMTARTVGNHVAKARAAADQAVRALSAALHRGSAEGIAHSEKPCKTCKVRAMSERERVDGTTKPSRHGECETCARWRQRNKGPRPADKLDAGPLREARAAKARRTSRGEGWGSS